MYQPKSLVGRCWNGAHRDRGTVCHAVEPGSVYGKALCGVQPGLRSNGWCEFPMPAVTCPKCLKRLAGTTV